MMTPEQQQLLYADETGEIEDIFEVQVLDAEFRGERLDALRKMLDDSSAAVRFDSLQVLVAWDEPVAIDRVLALLRERSDELVGQGTHRLHGADTTHDQLGHALALAVSVSGSTNPALREIAGLLLEEARTGFVENGLEGFISRLGDKTLLPQLVSVIRDKRDADDVRGAGDLLPAVVALDHAAAWELIHEFSGTDYFDRLAMGVAKALERIGDSDSKVQLEALALREDLPGACHVAQRALDKWESASS